MYEKASEVIIMCLSVFVSLCEMTLASSGEETESAICLQPLHQVSTEVHKLTSPSCSSVRKLIIYICCNYSTYIYIVMTLLTLITLTCREEIQRIKAGNPDISHREAFSAAAKNVSLARELSFFSLAS